jgi:regulatory protein
VPFGKAPKRLDREALEHYATALLTQRALSAAELRRKLTQRAADPADIDPLLEKLAGYGAIDDSRFAESFAHARKENRHFGRERVLRDLAAKRVPRELAERAVAQSFEGSDEIALIEDYLGRKYRGKALGEFLREPKNLAAAFRRLRNAGYSSSNSLKVLRRYSSLADSLGEEE